MKNVLTLLVLLLLAASPALAQTGQQDMPAQMGEEALQALSSEDSAAADEGDLPPAQSHTVTSTQGCYDQLEPDEALNIQRNSLKPYQECLELLAQKLEKKKTLEVQKQAEGNAVPEAETPRNYIRVQGAGDSRTTK